MFGGSDWDLFVYILTLRKQNYFDTVQSYLLFLLIF